MLPTGHVAAGYMTAYALIRVTNPHLPPEQLDQLLWWGMFFGFAPDIDVFWFFIKTKGLLVSPNVNISHRFYISHAPIVWLVAGVTVAAFSASEYWRSVGLLMWLGTWSHFLLDSIESGVMWLWPKQKVYALWNVGKKFHIEEKRFFRHSLLFLKKYSTQPTFYAELVVLAAACIIYFSN